MFRPRRCPRFRESLTERGWLIFGCADDLSRPLLAGGDDRIHTHSPLGRTGESLNR
jgi:hypothetical protein